MEMDSDALEAYQQNFETVTDAMQAADAASAYASDHVRPGSA